MTEVLFYHLTERTLEQTLPGLLEKSLERGWRAVVQAGSKERVEALDALLWTWRDDGFLAHSAANDAFAKYQPVFLTTETDNPNGAQIRFLVDGAEAPSLDGYERGVYLFDGHDAEAVAQARARWKAEKENGHAITYWQQKPGGAWERKA